MVSTLDIIRLIFNEKKELTLDELYEILSKNPKFTLSEGKLKHRIRSSIYSLKKRGEIMRMKDSTYKKTN